MLGKIKAWLKTLCRAYSGVDFSKEAVITGFYSQVYVFEETPTMFYYSIIDSDGVISKEYSTVDKTPENMKAVLTGKVVCNRRKVEDKKQLDKFLEDRGNKVITIDKTYTHKDTESSFETHYNRFCEYTAGKVKVVSVRREPSNCSAKDKFDTYCIEVDCKRKDFIDVLGAVKLFFR